KYHVPGNTPYTRYFLSHVLQFQFYKALCDAAGFKGPLYECSFYGNKAAGEKFLAMLEEGSHQPWQKTLKELTGGEQMDASAVLEYFAPLQEWLQQQNEGQSCGWTGAAAAADTNTNAHADREPPAQCTPSVPAPSRSCCCSRPRPRRSRRPPPATSPASPRPGTPSSSRPPGAASSAKSPSRRTASSTSAGCPWASTGSSTGAPTAR